MSSYLLQELKYLSDLLDRHPRITVTCSTSIFRMQVHDIGIRVFSVEIPDKYPLSPLHWQLPFLLCELNISNGQYQHSLFPLSAGVYEILTFYSSKLQVGEQISSLKNYLERPDSDLVVCSTLIETELAESFEQLSASSMESFEEIQQVPASIHSIDSTNSETDDSDGYETDSTVTGEDPELLDVVMVTETPKPLINAAMLQSFGMSPTSALKLAGNYASCMSYTRLCTELSYIHRSNQYNGPKNSLQLRVLNNDIYKWELKIWQFPENCKLNAQLLEYSPHDSCVTLEISFPTDYPFLPPFLRIVSPPIEAGHVIMGGAIFLDILLPQTCKMLGSRNVYSPCTQMEQLFTQVIHSMAEGNACILNSPAELENYTYEKAHFVYNSMIGLLTVDWNAVIKRVMETESRNNYLGYSPNKYWHV